MVSLVPFPLYRRQSLILEAVDKLLSVHGHPTNAFWRSYLRAIAEDLEASGIEMGEVRRQIRAFHEAVQMEIRARHLLAQ